MLKTVYAENNEQFLWKNNEQFYLMQKTNFQKDKSPRTSLHENEKSPGQIFKGKISMNKFQKINDEKFSKDFIKINVFSFLKGEIQIKK